MRQIAIALIALFYASVLCAQDVSDFVFLVKAQDCTARPSAVTIQTGFRYRGLKGIVTSLHGVVGCRSLSVHSERTLQAAAAMEIGKANIEADLALLISPQFQSGDQNGIEPRILSATDAIRDVAVVGHPSGIGLLTLNLQVSSPSIRSLRELVNPAKLLLLRARNSPNVLLPVLSLQGPLSPGHSGAPILDSAKHLVGIASGGLAGGTIGIGWAVPTSEISKLVTVSASTLSTLSAADSSALFDFQEGEPIQPKVTSIAGGWRIAEYPGGMRITQIGNKYEANGWSTVQGMFLTSFGSGTVSGQKVTGTYTIRFPNGVSVTGECDGEVSPDGMRMMSKCKDSVFGTYPSSAVRE